MDFTLPPEIEELRQRTRDFIEEHVLPLEKDPANFSEHENIPLKSGSRRCRRKAKKAGLWAPQSPKEYGGMALPIVAWAAIYEEAARSLFGPLAINCSAPDDGNMNLLARAGTPAQKEWWLRPIVEGKVKLRFRHDRACARRRLRSGHDPHPRREEKRQMGDPRPQVVHHRRRRRGAFHRHRADLRRQAPRADRVPLSPRPAGLAHPAPHPIMGPEEHGGHCELEFDGLEVADENVLLGVGDGLKATQIRLGPARLTHCMRWLGQAKRCIEIAQDYVEPARGLRHQARRP